MSKKLSPFLRDFDELLLQYPFDISLHAAEDEGRTEEPTEHRKRKAREEEGRVFLTQELPQSLVVMVTFTAIFFLAVYVRDTLGSFMIDFIRNPSGVFFSREDLAMVVKDCAVVFLKLFIPIGFVAMLVVVTTTMVQTGWHISTKNLRFNFQKIVPSLENLRKRTIFSKTQAFNVVKIFAKIALIGFIAFLFIRTSFTDFIALIHMDIRNAFADSAFMIWKIIMIISSVLLLLAIPDWFVQKAEFMEQLRMTKQEIKQEMKEMEGDPQVKARQRERARELIKRTMIANVKDADVVITNPTHYACAIQYDIELMNEPKLVAKGMDHMAKKIEKAKEYEIPLVENKPLARALYANVEVNDFIPGKFFQPVAEILATLEKFKQKVA